MISLYRALYTNGSTRPRGMNFTAPCPRLASRVAEDHARDGETLATVKAVRALSIQLELTPSEDV